MSSLFGTQTQTPAQGGDGGLFGNFNTTKPAGSSLFGSTLGTNAQSTPSPLFGSSQATPAVPASGGQFGAGASQAQPQQQQQQGSSLFSAASSTAQGGSLFGNTQSTQPGNSLFGGALAGNNQQQAGGNQGGSLFGSALPANNQQQAGGNQGSSLFGNAQTTQAGSLFGNQPAQQNTMFGNQPAQQTSTFGNQPAQQNSTFGNQSVQQNLMFGNQSAQQNPMFGNQPAQQNPMFGNAQQTQNAPNADEKKDYTQSAYFDSFLEKSRKRKAVESLQDDDLPKLELGLADLRHRIKNVAGHQGTAGIGPAHYLLRGSGVDPSTTDLNFFDSQATTKPRTDQSAEKPGIADTDVDSYLATIQTQSTLSMISDGLARSVQDFDAFLEDNVSMEWDAQRKRIYDHFGIKPKDESGAVKSSFSNSGFGRSAFGRSSRQNNGQSGRASQAPGASIMGRQSMHRSVIGSPGPVGLGQSTALFSDVENQKETSGLSPWNAPDNSFLQRRQRNFLDAVDNLNRDRLRQTPHPVFAQFSKITAESGDQQSQNIADAYKAMETMIDERSAVKERAFVNLYLNQATPTAGVVSIKKTILAGANKYLEMKFRQYLQDQIDKNPREARMGGIPDVISKIKGYIRTREASKNLKPDAEILQSAGNDYPWAIVFYLLRSGHIKEAAQYVDNETLTFRTIDRYFKEYITEYAQSPERRLSRALQERINNSYNQLHRVAPEHSIDPFKLACYKIIGRCDLANRKFDGLTPEIDDFIWLQFNLAREVSRVDEMATEVYGLDEVRTAISEIGARHFTAKNVNDKNKVYGMYFYLQILCGLFEQAIAYLYPFNHVDAIHFAIALTYYGLLRVSAPGTTNDLLSFTTRQEPQVNFGSMVAYYTRDFRAADAVAAVDYMILICLNADLPGDIGRQHANLCHEALRELVLESREFAELLGDIRYDGQRIKGAIEERKALISLEASDDFLRSVTISAASQADDNGRVIDAVLLYHLAREYDLVLAIINRALSEAINVDIGQDPLRLQPLKSRDGSKSQDPQASSLSLTSVDDPAELARTILDLYTNNQGTFKLHGDANRNTCRVLLKMSEAKAQVQEGRWAVALDTIANLDIIPLNGSVRELAARFDTLPSPVARNVPCLILWSLGCINQERERLASAAFGQNAQVARQRLYSKSKDLMVFAGAIKYHMPQHVYDTMSRLSTWRD